MYIVLVIAIFTLLMWVNNIIITTTNAKVNQYTNNAEIQKNENFNAIWRIILLLISSLCWSAVFIWWN